MNVDIVDDSFVVDPNKVDNVKINENELISSEAKNGDIESDVESKVDVSICQIIPRIYDKEFLLSLRDSATNDAISMSNQDNIRDIIKKVQ